MNLIQRTILKRRNEGTFPEQALLFSLLCLRGGEVRQSILNFDYQEWVGMYGVPTYPKLEAWARTLDFESSLVEPLLKILPKKQKERLDARMKQLNQRPVTKNSFSYKNN